MEVAKTPPEGCPLSHALHAAPVPYRLVEVVDWQSITFANSDNPSGVIPSDQRGRLLVRAEQRAAILKAFDDSSLSAMTFANSMAGDSVDTPIGFPTPFMVAKFRTQIM